MSKPLVYGFIALVILSAVAIFAIYGILSLTNPIGRFSPLDTLALAGQLEATRNLSIAAVLLGALILRKWTALATLLITIGLIELGDAVIGVVQHQSDMIVTPALSGALYLICGVYLADRLRRQGRGK
ncbi:MAG TPA: hypothetical protein VH593_27460 [Ktedonobacteraceae bacterium]